MKKNAVKTKVVVSDKAQKVGIVHELDLNELSVEEKALVCHLLLEGKELPHPLTHEALSALMVHAKDADGASEEMPSAPPERSEAEKQVDAVFVREFEAAGEDKAKRASAIKKLATSLADRLLGGARVLLERHKANRAAGSIYRDWISQTLMEALEQALATLTYCTSTTHREAMKIVTGSPLQLFLDGDYLDTVGVAQVKLLNYLASPTKSNWAEFRDSMPVVKSNLRKLRRMLLEDSYVTNGMFEEMGQPDRPSYQRHPIPPPDYTPRVIINPVKDVPSQLDIELLTPQDKAVIGPNGLVGEVKIAIAPSSVALQDIHPDDDALGWHSFLSTKAKFKPTVPDQMRNKLLVLVARIVNKRGQKGEWGTVHQVQAT